MAGERGAGTRLYAGLFSSITKKRPEECFVPAAVISPHHRSPSRGGIDVKVWAELTDSHRGFCAVMLLTAFCLVSSLILPPLLISLYLFFLSHAVFFLSLLPCLSVASQSVIFSRLSSQSSSCRGDRGENVHYCVSTGEEQHPLP